MCSYSLLKIAYRRTNIMKKIFIFYLMITILNIIEEHLIHIHGHDITPFSPLIIFDTVAIKSLDDLLQ